MKYKTYKNKLTTILRISDKQYYNKIFVQEKNNMKGTWAILNNIIKKGHQAPSYPQEFVDNGSVVKKQYGYSKWFQQFFCRHWPKSGNENWATIWKWTVENFLGNRNNQSLFLSSVEESEIIEIVKNWKNKTSTGFDNIDMTIVKQVISHIVKPLSYVCNMSLTSGMFPNNMKIA